MSNKYKYVAGIDEAGRGPIAGPVAVGVFVTRKNFAQKLRKIFPGINDSKKLSEIQRERIFSQIEIAKSKKEVDFSVIFISAKVIDQKGITHAVQLGINKAIKKLKLDSKNTFVYLGGLLKAPKEFSQETVIKGDAKIAVISAASICAKVIRDRYMKKLAKKYPNYGFEKHKGYGTKEHYKNLSKFGMSFEHRKTYLKKYLV